MAGLPGVHLQEFGYKMNLYSVKGHLSKQTILILRYEEK